MSAFSNCTEKFPECSSLGDINVSNMLFRHIDENLVKTVCKSIPVPNRITKKQMVSNTHLKRFSAQAGLRHC